MRIILVHFHRKVVELYNSVCNKPDPNYVRLTVHCSHACIASMHHYSMKVSKLLNFLRHMVTRINILSTNVMSIGAGDMSDMTSALYSEFYDE